MVELAGFRDSSIGFLWQQAREKVLIAGQWPELHEEAQRVEQTALSDPGTACFNARRWSM